MKVAMKLLIGAALVTGSFAVPANAQVANGTVQNFVPLTDEMLRNPDPEDWPMYRRNYQGWGYSPLDQINVDTVKGLQLVWSRALDPGSNESTPLVYDGVAYIGMAGDVIQAINAADGTLIWEYRRQLPERDTMSSLGENKRSIALYGDKVYFVSWDNFVVALDAKSGQLVWETDRGQGTSDGGVTNSNGPIVVNGVVIAGSTCQQSGFGCYATGHDATNGEELWRNMFIPKPGEEGDDTWGGAPFEGRWMTGSWGGYTYDPDLDLVFYGSTGAGPASEAQRGTPGGTMYGTNTRFAVHPKTGEIAWRHQVLPRDNWDQECTYEAIIVDSPINPDANAAGMLAVGTVSGETRKVQTGVPCKTGIAWTLDAATGEFIWAKSTVEQNLVANIDNTGLVTVNEDMVMSDPTKPIAMCPTYLGGRDWPPAAYSPEHNVFYVPLNNMCADVTARQAEATPADVYNTDLAMKVTPGKENVGRIDAISVETGGTVWTHEIKSALYAPVLATKGDLLFTGGFDRYFRAVSQTTGEEVWSVRLPSVVSGHAVTFGINGRQYVAVPTGGSLVSGYLGTVNAGIDNVSGSNALFVFALPES